MDHERERGSGTSLGFLMANKYYVLYYSSFRCILESRVFGNSESLDTQYTTVIESDIQQPCL